MREPKPVRVVTRAGWRREFIQYENHYILKTYAVVAGGKLHLDTIERFEGMAPTEVIERAEPEPEPGPIRDSRITNETMKEAILRREEQESNMRDAGFYCQGGVYIRNHENPSH
jgi:hypothetical protein